MKKKANKNRDVLRGVQNQNDTMTFCVTSVVNDAIPNKGLFEGKRKNVHKTKTVPRLALKFWNFNLKYIWVILKPKIKLFEEVRFFPKRPKVVGLFC